MSVQNDANRLTELKLQSVLPEQLKKLGEKWGWILGIGVAYTIVGIIAFMLPLNATVGLTVVLGAVLIAGGVLQLIHFFQLRKHVGDGWRILQAVTALAAGFVILRFPEAGMMGITITLSLYFLMSGSARWVLALGMRPHRGWGWAFASATSSFILGIYVLLTFPASAFWLPGLLVGIDLIILGTGLIGFSFDLKNHHVVAQPSV
jgi:uncharacterized membrane protein HdeD (DUF308 family)